MGAVAERAQRAHKTAAKVNFKPVAERAQRAHKTAARLNFKPSEET